MEINWGYGIITIPFVKEVYYTIKLRMNNSTWSFIKTKFNELPFQSVVEKNGYVTIVSVTHEHCFHQDIKRAISKGQQAQLRKQLEMWETSESNFKTPLKWVFQEKTQETIL